MLMSRRIVALLIAIYAIAFAFGAMAAIRWPSLMLLAGFMVEPDALGGLSEINWRELGIAFGAPYFLAALCFYAAALALGRGKADAMVWYMMGCFAGFPCVFLVDFEPGWWSNPSPAEGAIAGGALAALLLGMAVRELTFGPPRQRISDVPASDTSPPQQAGTPAPEALPKPQKKASRRPLRRPVPAAIACQRAFLAAEGRRILARQRR